MNTRPIRVLHVLGSLNRGGAETWLLNVLRHIDRDRFRLDFAVHTDQPAAHDNEARALGARILPCLSPHRPLRYLRNLRRILRSEGPYDVVHSHVHHFSGIVLCQAHRCGVPTRLAHSHSDTSGPDRAAGMARRGYLKLTERLVRRHATLGLAASGKAATALFGSGWRDDPRWRTHYCGIDLQPFRETSDRDLLRREIGLPLDATVVGHVGRFVPPKNHRFLLDVFAELSRRLPLAHLVLIGDGEERPAIEGFVRRLGLEGSVTFAGLRSDVPRLLSGAVDVFAFPSLHEGLGLALLEAQAAGLPCVLSDAVPTEVDVVLPLMRRIPLDGPRDAWVAAILDAIGRPRGVPQRAAALAALEESDFNIRNSVRRLEDLYSGTLRTDDGGARRP